jgi:hypothetical protein
VSSFIASDVTNLPHYEKGILVVKKITSGPIGVGTSFQLLVHQLGIRMRVKLLITAWEPNRCFSYRVNSGSFPIEIHYKLRSQDGAACLLAERQPHSSGLWKWLIPLLSIPPRRKLTAELNGLKHFLETHSEQV